MPGTDRRKAAAAVYGVTTERFRKSQEHDVIAELAAAVLTVARRTPGRPAEVVREPGADPAAPAVPAVPAVRTVPAVARPARPGAGITVRVGPIEDVRDVDILVSSENTYLEMSKTFRPTVSGALRRAAALRDAQGEIVDDVLSRELGVWLRTHGRTGMPVRPGTVVATSSGALAAQGVRRIHHAAIATPVGDGDRYHVSPAVLGEAVRRSFELARHESEFLSADVLDLLSAAGLRPGRTARGDGGPAAARRGARGAAPGSVLVGAAGHAGGEPRPAAHGRQLRSVRATPSCLNSRSSATSSPRSGTPWRRSAPSGPGAGCNRGPGASRVRYGA